MIKAKQIYPQTCDMGSDYQIYEFTEETSLQETLIWIKHNLSAWGTVTIKTNNGEIIRKFDYDLYNDKQFYCNLSWEKLKKVKKISSHSCFMSCDIDIELK